MSAQDPLFPDLTSFRPALLVQRTRITAFSEDYQQPAAPERCAQPRRIPEWLVANRFSHRQLIHILPQCGHKSHKDSVRLLRAAELDGSTNTRLSHPRASTSCQAGASMARSRECQPPHQEGLLDSPQSTPSAPPICQPLTKVRSFPTW